MEDPSPRAAGPTWRDLLEHWQLVEADLHQQYGLDVEDAQLLAARPWRWLRVRVVQLLSIPPSVVVRPDGKSFTVPATRIGLALDPPKTD